MSVPKRYKMEFDFFLFLVLIFLREVTKTLFPPIKIAEIYDWSLYIVVNFSNAELFKMYFYVICIAIMFILHSYIL